MTAKECETIIIVMKHNDAFSIVLTDPEGTVTRKGTNFYRPEFILPCDDPTIAPGDYTLIAINRETGQILNWKKPAIKKLQKITKPIRMTKK